MNHEIGSYQDKGVKVTMVAKEEGALTHLYTQAVNRLMHGIRDSPDQAIAGLKAAQPKRIKEISDALIANYTPEGIAQFETSMRKGFKYYSFWRNG